MGFPYTFPFYLKYEQAEAIDVDVLLLGQVQSEIFLDMIIGSAPREAGRFVIEIRDLSGSLLSVLENASNVVYSQGVGMPSLEFDVPSNDEKRLTLSRDREIWLCDCRIGSVLAKFRPSMLADRRS